MRDEGGTPALPSLLPLDCPVCDEETDHRVLKGTVGLRGEYTLDAVVRCETCGTTRHIVHREPGERELPVVVSHGAESRRARIVLGDDETVTVGEELLVDGVTTRVTGIETRAGTRRPSSPVPDVATLWVKEWETVVVGFAINLGKKTIAKTMEVTPDAVFGVGEEHTFDRLRVTIHSIKTTGRLLRRGSAEAGEIVRVFARPTREAEPSRPRRTPSRERQAAERRIEKKKEGDRRSRAGDRRARAGAKDKY